MPSRTISFLPHADLFSSTPTSTVPLSSLTTCARAEVVLPHTSGLRSDLIRWKCIALRGVGPGFIKYDVHSAGLLQNLKGVNYYDTELLLLQQVLSNTAHMFPSQVLGSEPWTLQQNKLLHLTLLKLARIAKLWMNPYPLLHY